VLTVKLRWGSEQECGPAERKSSNQVCLTVFIPRWAFSSIEKCGIKWLCNEETQNEWRDRK
jgi:hypothetical protein